MNLEVGGPQGQVSEPALDGLQRAELGQEEPGKAVPLFAAPWREDAAGGTHVTNQGWGRCFSRRRMTISQSLEHSWIKVRWGLSPLRDGGRDKPSASREGPQSGGLDSGR